MKTYEEMTDSVLKKAQHRIQTRRRRNYTLITTAACCLVVLTALLVSDKTDQGSQVAILANPTATTSVQLKDDIVTQIRKPRAMLLCAQSKNEEFRIMEEKIKIPYKAELRVTNIAGLTEEEKHKLGKEEAAYISKLWGDRADEIGFGRYMLDNVMVTTISVGELGVKLEDLDEVSRLRVKVTETGMVISYPRVEDGKTSAYTFEEGQELLIDITGDSLKACLELNQRDTLGLFWHISPWAVTKLDKDPDMDLSLLSSKIVIMIDYTDGTEETMTVNMKVESDGKVFAILEETVVNA